MEQWLASGEYNTLTQNGYVFKLLESGAPCVAVCGLFGIVTTYYGSYFHTSTTMADVVVCQACWLEWLATPPWNDTPPTLKVPPTCSHLEVQDAS